MSLNKSILYSQKLLEIQDFLWRQEIPQFPLKKSEYKYKL